MSIAKEIVRDALEIFDCSFTHECANRSDAPYPAESVGFQTRDGELALSAECPYCLTVRLPDGEGRYLDLLRDSEPVIRYVAFLYSGSGAVAEAAIRLFDRYARFRTR